MSPIYSHPEIPLIKHLKEVAKNATTVIENSRLNLTIDKGIVQDLAYIATAVHDIGKATKNFQIYLESEGEKVIKPKHHAMISAFVAKSIAERYLSATDLKDFDKVFLPYLLFTAVKRHHGNLENFDDELNNTNFDDLQKQIDNFYDAETQEILSTLLVNVNVQLDWTVFKAYIKKKEFKIELEDFYEEEFKETFHDLSAQKRASYFYLHQLFYATLLYSDKKDVILKKQILKKNEFNFLAIQNFREKEGFNNPTKEIDRQKNKAYFEGLKNLETVFDIEQHLYSITLPTGLGKTITSLAIAMKMKELLSEYQQQAKIIITIPFTSIIDQNYQVFEDIFHKPTSDILLKHHHLSDPIYKMDDDDMTDLKKSKFLIETWQSEIVVTTFVQLLETIFTNDKGKLLKFPNLTNAIIILDEVQQIQYKYWPLIRQLFKTLGKQFNCYFILMSATQPLIFEPEKEITELIPNYQQYFKLPFLNRTKIINHTKTKISFDDFTETVVNYHQTHPKKSILVILNTKKITKKCFQDIEKRIPKEQANLYFLTTLLTPFERKQIIKKIKASTKKRIENPDPKDLPDIIVSTQLIEAGVDISVDTVFRNIAPIDSIIQAAGRANRYNENPERRSEIHLYDIDDLSKGTTTVYGKILISKTRNVLKNIVEIEEKDYLQLIDAYFQEVKRQADNIKSKELEYLRKLQFKCIGEFKVIAERDTESVFVQLNDAAVKVWNQYKEIYENEKIDLFKKREAFSKIKAQFYDFVINVPVKCRHGQKGIGFDGSEKTDLNFYLWTKDSKSESYQYDPENFRKNIGYQYMDKSSMFF